MIHEIQVLLKKEQTEEQSTLSHDSVSPTKLHILKSAEFNSRSMKLYVLRNPQNLMPTKNDELTVLDGCLLPILPIYVICTSINI